MADLSQLLGDVYADAPAPGRVGPRAAKAIYKDAYATLVDAYRSSHPEVAEQHDEASMSTADALEAAFADWVPGPQDEAPSAERAFFAEAIEQAPIAHDPVPETAFEDLFAAAPSSVVESLAWPEPTYEPVDETTFEEVFEEVFAAAAPSPIVETVARTEAEHEEIAEAALPSLDDLFRSVSHDGVAAADLGNDLLDATDPLYRPVIVEHVARRPVDDDPAEVAVVENWHYTDDDILPVKGPRARFRLLRR